MENDYTDDRKPRCTKNGSMIDLYSTNEDSDDNDYSNNEDESSASYKDP